MDNFLQQLINGLTLGSIYGLIAIGYTMVYGIIGMINFAHGDVFMLSAFIALLIFLVLSQVVGVASLPVAFVIVLIGGMVLTSVWNWTIERIAYRPLRGSFRLAPLISAIGMSIFLSNFVQVGPGPAQQADAADVHRHHQRRRGQPSDRTAVPPDRHHGRHRASCWSASGGWCRRPRSAGRNAPASRTARWRR